MKKNRKEEKNKCWKTKMEPKKKFAQMKQRVLQDESMDIHVASMSNSGEQQEHEKNSRKIEENSREKRQNENIKKRQVWTKNLTQTKRMDAPKAWMALDTN